MITGKDMVDPTAVEPAVDFQKEADKLRAEAKHLLNYLLGTPTGFSNDTSDRFVDCVVGAAILQMTKIMRDASEDSDWHV